MYAARTESQILGVSSWSKTSLVSSSDLPFFAFLFQTKGIQVSRKFVCHCIIFFIGEYDFLMFLLSFSLSLSLCNYTVSRTHVHNCIQPHVYISVNHVENPSDMLFHGVHVFSHVFFPGFSLVPLRVPRVSPNLAFSTLGRGSGSGQRRRRSQQRSSCSCRDAWLRWNIWHTFVKYNVYTVCIYIYTHGNIHGVTMLAMQNIYLWMI